MRRVAEGRARDAYQDKLDAEAAAAAARAEADESSRSAAAARAAQIRNEWQQQRRRTKGDGALSLTGARSRSRDRGARERAARRHGQRTAERTAASEAHEQGLQQVRVEFEQVRADAEAVIAAARERATAAEKRAQQRAAERTAASEAAEQAAQQLRGELARVRADADAEIAASRGWAAGEAAAARGAADAEVVRAYAAADDAVRQAQAKAARSQSTQPLSIPPPPLEFRTETGHIDNALNALHQIDYVLEVGIANGGDPDIPVDIALMQTLVSAVREHAMYLSDESQSGTSSMSHPPRDAAAVNAEVAVEAFRAFLQRIETVVHRVGGRNLGSDAEIVGVVTSMLADPWVQRVRRPDS